MVSPAEQSPFVDRLRQIEAVTDAALAHLDVEELLDELLDRTRELLQVDTAAVLLLDPSGTQLVAAAARGLEAEVTQRARVPVGSGFAGRIAAEKRPVILDRVDHTTVRNPILRDRGVKSLLGVPLLSGGQVLGVLHVGSLTARRFTDEDAELVQLVADRIALATQVRLSETDRLAAVALQNSLLPGRLPDVPGLSFAARYAPGGGEAVGGDWYDVFTLPSGSVWVAMGDVVGRGLRAAVVMGRIRSTLRSYALTTSEPAEVLALVDRKLQYFEPGEMATVLLAVIPPDHGRIEISSAGHPLPMLAPPGEPAVVVEVPVDPPLGAVAVRSRRSGFVELPAGAVVCLYTDGLVERRNVGLDERVELMRRTVTSADPDAVCVELMRQLVGEHQPGDDVAVLAFRRAPDGLDTTLRLDVPAVAASLGRVRIALRRWLQVVGAGESDSVDMLVAVGEATANAVEHAYGGEPGEVTIEAAMVDGDVVVRVRDHGQWRAPRGENRGRGTSMMERTSDEVLVRSSDEGTEVEIRRRLTR